MKRTRINNRKTWVTVVALTLVALIVTLFFGGWKLEPGVVVKPSADAARFKSEYPEVSDQNQFIYATSDKIKEVLTSGTGVVFLGFPECPWCQQLAPRLDEVAREEGVSNLYYFNIREARDKNDDTYQQLVSLLSDHLSKDASGEPRIYAPDVTFVKDGQVVGRFEHRSNADVSGAQDYWNDAETARQSKDQLRDLLRKTK